MSSFTRCMQTGAKLVNPYRGRGSKLGTKNPKDASLLARLARDRKWGRK